jgi:hypothetical protein
VEGSVSEQVLLRDLVAIPDTVHDGDFVLTLAKGVRDKSTVTDYVVTEPLAANFDKALDLIKSALETGASRAAYLNGSFGSGKSHFMAVLHAVLKGDPDARGKKGLADVVAKHDKWLTGRKFLLVPYHLPDSQSLDAAILGGYVAHVAKDHPGQPLPAVYRDDSLIADAAHQRRQLGDEKFIASLPATGAEAEEWGAAAWDTASLDQAFAEPQDGKERRRLVGDLLIGPFQRYAGTVKADQASYIEFDEGLSVISEHAKNVLGYDAIVLLLDELVLWLAGLIADSNRINEQVQKVSKLTESAAGPRPAPIISFVPRQRDLRDLVSKSSFGNEVTSLFDMLKYWDGRFEQINLDDSNLPAIVHERLLKPKDQAARDQLDAAFETASRMPQQAWEILLDTHGERGSREAFRLTYPFSPAFTHAMVDISGALQRERTALKLMQQLLVNYRDTLPAGQLMPLGAIFDVLAAGADRPFTDKLKDEFETAKKFYSIRVRPALLQKNSLTEEQALQLVPKHPFRADDLIVKTMLLAALVPNVPALNGLTATRLAALNHGSIVTMVRNAERAQVAKTLKFLQGQFGEFRLSGSEDDPRVDLALIGVDTEGIIRDSRHADDDAARRRLVREMLWAELNLKEEGAFETRTTVTWRGTTRAVEVLLDNVSDPDRMPTRQFQPNPGTIRMIIDYPFDEGGRFPVDDMRRVHELTGQLGELDTIVWLPHFLSEDRKADLSTLIVINYLLERDRLTQVTPNLTAEDRHHAKTQLENRKNALTATLREAVRRAYGVISATEEDLGPRAAEQVLAFARDLTPRIQGGQGMRTAFDGCCGQLLAHRFPAHPDFDPNGRGVALKLNELETVLGVVELAAQDSVGRHEVPRADIPTLKKIANPLKLGIMHEAAFVLSREWPDQLGRKAGAASEVTVGQLRGWIGEEQPGLPEQVQNLIISCYGIQADKAWLRAGRPAEPPRLDKIPDDLKLRSQELPSATEFDEASTRAAAIFRAQRQPVRTARSVHAIADAIRRNAGGRLEAARNLDAELAGHAATLGLDETADRQVTSRLLTALLGRLASTTDDTQTVRVLASAELPKENAFYFAHLDSADRLTPALRQVNWQVLDALAASEETDAEAVVIVSALRQAARRDEHEIALGTPLRTASENAISLFLSRAKKQETQRQGGQAPAGGNSGGGSLASDATTPVPGARELAGTPEPSAAGVPLEPVRVPARGIPGFVERICEAADEYPDAEFEIAWRIVEQ